MKLGKMNYLVSSSIQNVNIEFSKGSKQRPNPPQAPTPTMFDNNNAAAPNMMSQPQHSQYSFDETAFNPNQARNFQKNIILKFKY